MTSHREWSQLPSELLEIVAEHIVSISDFIRFRSVCKSWHEAALPKYLRPQPPLLFLPYNYLNADRYIFSLVTRRVHRLHLPQLVGKRIITTTNGWMLMADVETNSLSLLNPITLAQIQLPPADNFENPVITFGQIYPDLIANSFVVLIHGGTGRYSNEKRKMFCKVGDESWSVLDINLEHGYFAIAYHKGKFFSGDLECLYIHDPNNPCSEYFVPAASLYPLADYDYSIYYSADFYHYNGELLLVLDSKEYPDPGIWFYKLDYDGQRIKASEVKLEHYAMICYSFMFCVKDFPQIKECCVYDDWGFAGENRDKPVVDIFDWKHGTCDAMECGWQRPDDCKERPQWITPSFQ